MFHNTTIITTTTLITTTLTATTLKRRPGGPSQSGSDSKDFIDSTGNKEAAVPERKRQRAIPGAATIGTTRSGRQVKLTKKAAKAGRA
ncbi:hypothetical protein B0T18DRAFT_428549 [Schizothecium vesticola]|uniref:Uncharacterized protein n=1 Tax=Schizothecium vesticola TaxID=314040 RepID=A0AA40K981_9PEZI|nr:hypothetical protein B0T18DRAFT_428549 [Schizothecium vesticola]